MIGYDICRIVVKNMTTVGIDVLPLHPSLVIGKNIALFTLKGNKIVVGFETEAGILDLRITI